MPKRIKVTIAWDPRSESFAAIDPATGGRLANYRDLMFGDTALAKAGKADDPGESVKTFTDAAVVAHPLGALDPNTGKVAQVFKNTAPNKAAQLVGWVTVPD